MKKILLFTLLLANFFLANAFTKISAYRWRNDNGNEINATWKADLNTPIEINNLDPLRIRIAVEEYSTGFNTSTVNISSKLQSSDDNGTTWKLITDPDSPFDFASATVPSETATTQQIAPGDPAAFVPGVFISANSGTTTTWQASFSKFTELEFSIKPNATIKKGKTYTFRIENMPNDIAYFPTLTTATDGTSLHFDGLDNYVELPNSLPTTYTKEAWIKGDAFNGPRNIISGGSTDLHALYVIDGQLSAGHNNSWSDVIDNEQLNPDTWYHVAVTYDQATNTMTLYKNGVIVSTNNNVLPFIGGAIRIGAFDPNDNIFSGAIDEVRIWNKVLTEAEILNTMNCELPGAQTGLVAYYKFNQGIADSDNTAITSLIDSSGNESNGELISFQLSGSTSNWINNSIIETGSTCIIVNPTLGVDDHNQDFNSDIKVYPNPSNNEFSINSSTDGTAQVFDVNGRAVQSQKLNSGTTKLHLGNSPTGIYLLKITNQNNQTQTVKLIKN